MCSSGVQDQYSWCGLPKVVCFLKGSRSLLWCFLKKFSKTPFKQFTPSCLRPYTIYSNVFYMIIQLFLVGSTSVHRKKYYFLQHGELAVEKSSIFSLDTLTENFVLVLLWVWLFLKLHLETLLWFLVIINIFNIMEELYINELW